MTCIGHWISSEFWVTMTPSCPEDMMNTVKISLAEPDMTTLFKNLRYIFRRAVVNSYAQ